MYSDNEFTVDVISNASMDIFPKNKIGYFTNRLRDSLNLEGDWFVGIREIFYPLAHKVLKHRTTFWFPSCATKKYVLFDFFENDTIESLISELNETLAQAYSDLGLHKPWSETVRPPVLKMINDEKKKSKVSIEGGVMPDSSTFVYPAFADEILLNMLGFDHHNYMMAVTDESSDNPSVRIAQHKPDTSTKSHLMFIYTDIIKDHYVGDSKTRLLRVVPLKRDQIDKIGQMTYNVPHYYPVRSNKIEDISIKLTDEMGSPMKFKTGRIFISLHFIRKMYKNNNDIL